MSNTTTPCDGGQHAKCPGSGLIQGVLRPPHEPDAEGEIVWVTVDCECPCHVFINPAASSRSGRSDGG